MRKAVILTCCLLLFWVKSLSAQSQCTVTHYDEFSGMTQWWVTQIVQDKQGMIWISTWNGLNRYDGYEFVCFKSHAGDGVEIPSDRIDDIVLADNGSLRCNIDSRVFGFCTKTCRFFALSKEEEQQWIKFFDDKHKKELAVEILGKSQRHQDLYGTEWLISWDGGLRYRNPANGQLIDYPADWHGAKKIRKCIVDTERNVWLTSNYGIFKMTFEKKSYKPFEQEVPMQVRCFYVDQKKRYWIATRDDATVRLYNAKNELLGYLGRDGKLHAGYTSFGSPVYHIMQDSKGSFWLSTKPDGLYRLREDAADGFKIEHFTHQEDDDYSLSDNNIYYTVEDDQGRLWIATFETGLNCLEHPYADKLRFLNKNNVLNYPKDVVRRTRQLYITKEHILLAATTTGLVVADISPEKPQDIHFKYHQKDAYRPNSLSNNAVMYVTEYDPSHIFVCTESGGLNLIESSDLLGDKLEFKHFNDLTGFPSDVTLSAVPQKDYLMVICKNQIVKLYLSGEQKGKIEPFFIHDRFRFSDARPVQLPDGRWIFGLQDGAFTTLPEDIRNSGFVPPIVLTGLSIGNQSLQRFTSPADSLILSPENRTFTIHFAALDYSGNSNIRYAIQMGDNNSWNDIGINRTASFYNLNPGEYHLRIRSTNGDGVWVDNDRLLTIIVTPTFWETRWSYLIYALGILLVIAISSYLLFVFYRLRQKMSIEQQISDIKLKFFTNVSHELRTPLTLIYGFVSEILKEPDMAQSLRTRMTVVSDNASRMLRLVNQILDVYKLESNKMKLRVRHLELIGFVRSVMGYFNNMAESHQIDYRFDSNTESLYMWADSDKLDKILFNLISNAFKYTPTGKMIRISVEEAGQNVFIKVEDQGVGISQESKKDLFKEFSHSSSKNIFNLPSSGLGLAFVKNLVTLHGGTIQVDSEVGVGSTFTVTLPLDRQHFEEEHAEFILDDETHEVMEERPMFGGDDISMTEESDPKTGKVSILIVEDNAQMRYLLHTILADKYHVIEAENGERGLQLAQEHIPDLIISDIMMPVMNGMEMLTQIRSKQTVSHIPVIMLTAKSDDESLIHSIREGVDSYIVKPFNSEILRARIENLLEQRARLQRYYQSRFMGLPSIAHEPNEQVVSPTGEEVFMENLSRIVYKHLTDGDFTVEQMANEMNMSRSVLFKKLKAMTDSSPNEYLKAIRMRRAAELLKTTNHSVTEITYMIGINDPHYFSNCFKKQYGLSPTEFRTEKNRRYE